MATEATYESLPCFEPAMEANYELLFCSELAEEAALILSALSVTAEKAVSEHSVLSVPVNDSKLLVLFSQICLLRHPSRHSLSVSLLISCHLAPSPHVCQLLNCRSLQSVTSRGNTRSADNSTESK